MEVVLLFALIIGLMLIGVPIAFSLGLSSIAFLLAAIQARPSSSIAQTLFPPLTGITPCWQSRSSFWLQPSCRLAVWLSESSGFQLRSLGTSRRPGDCRGLCLHDVCRAVGLVSCDGCGHRLDCDRWHAAGWLYKRVRCRGHLRMRALLGISDPAGHRHGGLCIAQQTCRLGACFWRVLCRACWRDSC